MTTFRHNTIRKPDHDYSRPGAYFVTICLHQRVHRFGSIANGNSVDLSEPGAMIDRTIQEIPSKFDCTTLDEYVVMPDHVHLILVIHEVNQQTSTHSLGHIMRWFKSVTTLRYVRGVEREGWPRFDTHFWQRDFYDRILRDEIELETRRRYIRENPYRWLERIRMVEEEKNLLRKFPSP